jgi:hypothetical protein
MQIELNGQKRFFFRAAHFCSALTWCLIFRAALQVHIFVAAFDLRSVCVYARDECAVCVLKSGGGRHLFPCPHTPSALLNFHGKTQGDIISQPRATGSREPLRRLLLGKKSLGNLYTATHGKQTIRAGAENEQ